MTHTSITFLPKTPTKLEAAIIPLDATGKAYIPKAFDTPDLAALITHLRDESGMKLKAGATCTHILPPKSFAKRLVLLCVGAPDTNVLALEEAGGKLAETLLAHKVAAPCLLLEALGARTAEAAAALVNGLMLRSYRFDTYRTRGVDDLPKPFKQIDVVCGQHAADAEEAYATLSDITHGVYVARNLVCMPPNDLTPAAFAKHASDLAKEAGLSCTLFDKKDLAKMGMGSFVAVGQGSENDPYMVVLEYAPKGAAKEQPIALVGKGITFDSGGLSLKPGPSMPEMKGDMAGAAAVLGTMVALARMQSKRRIVAALALAENLPSDDAYRPSDILKSYSGQTIEVLNTDAEGRLVLCDTMTYVQRTYNPSTLVDIATLTGAAVVALGDVFSGVFTPHDLLNTELSKAGAECGELVWRMPLHEAFDADIRSDIADMKNIGSPGKAGSSTAAAFLHRFVEKGVEWAHIDMAPMMMLGKDRPLYPRGATGWGVRLLTYWLTMSRGA